jgi:3,4-dihydroxy-2-butanone 4-phosphate synthase
MATTPEMKSKVPTAAAGASPFCPIPEALEELRAGRFLIVLDDEDRENEGDLILPCEMATPEALAFCVNHTSGVICVGAPGDRLDALKLPAMVRDNEDPKCTAFTVTVDYKLGTTTGISAHDRALTIRKLADPKASASEFTRPGHVFPLRAVPGGVLERGGHTEASVDLARLAGFQPLGFLCEIVNPDGTMMRRPGLERLGAKHGIKLITIEALQQYRRDTERGRPRVPVSYYRGVQQQQNADEERGDGGSSSSSEDVPRNKVGAFAEVGASRRNNRSPSGAAAQNIVLMSAVAFGAGLLGSLIGFGLARRKL